MSRHINPGSGPAPGAVRSLPGGRSKTSSVALVNYIRYIPAEIVGLYIAAMGLLSRARGPNVTYQMLQITDPRHARTVAHLSHGLHAALPL